MARWSRSPGTLGTSESVSATGTPARAATRSTARAAGSTPKTGGSSAAAAPVGSAARSASPSASAPPGASRARASSVATRRFLLARRSALDCSTIALQSGGSAGWTASPIWRAGLP